MNWLTEQDFQNYGGDLINVTQRAAWDAVGPHLQNLEQQNIALQQRLAKEARHRLDQQVALAIPNYRDIDSDPRWHEWLLGIDPLSGRVRQQWLNAAIADADPVRVISFFKGFLASIGGQVGSAQRHGGGQQPTTRQRLSLSTTNGQIYSPADIRRLYDKQRRGGFSEADWSRIENDIIDAARTGRVTNAQPLGVK